MARPNQARLDLGALTANVATVRKLAPGARVMGVVKANAYGHGAVTIARALATHVDALAVASIEEALELRESGVTEPVLLMEGVFEADELQTAARAGFWITIDNDTQLSWLEAAKTSAPLCCWLKIDTGMHRLGIDPQQVAEFHSRITASRAAAGSPLLSTHFASADDLESEQTRVQIARFEAATRGFDGPRSAANSAAVMAWPEAHYEWVRPGYMLYGNSPLACPSPVDAPLQPVMTLCSAVISVTRVGAGETVGYGATWQAQRESLIATATIGYGDGYPRLAANGTPVLVNGQRAPLAGRVSMDMITIDVTDLPPVSIGDPVVAWGDGLPLNEVAAHAGTIGYELTTRMPMRTPRIVA
jgi:alanine racemase